MKQIDSFRLKDGRVVQIVLPSMDLLQSYTDFINRLSQEDTYLYFSSEHYSYETQKNWLENALREIKYKKHYFIWACIDGPSTALGAGKVIGNCDVRRGGNRESHIGSIGLFIDKEFRGLGLGKYMANLVLQESKALNYQIIRAEAFLDNEIAIKLYKKFGFQEYGRLPKGLYRQKKYSDKIEMYKVL